MGCKCRGPSLTQANVALGARRGDGHKPRGGCAPAPTGEPGARAEGCPCGQVEGDPPAWGVCPCLPPRPRAHPRPRQHLALPVDADVVGVLPARCPVHHGCGSFCVEVETLGQAVEGTGFHTPWERSRGSNGAAKEGEERCREPDLGNSCLTLGPPTPLSGCRHPGGCPC